MQAIKSILGCFLIFLISACRPSLPMIVTKERPGDKQLSCAHIQDEIVNNQTKMMARVPAQQKVLQNTILGVSGTMFVIPWFFMDYSEKPRVEIQSYELRNDRLRLLAANQHCGRIPEAHYSSLRGTQF